MEEEGTTHVHKKAKFYIGPIQDISWNVIWEEKEMVKHIVEIFTNT